jgi:tetratricopeptide (TPR) repeat protein
MRQRSRDAARGRSARRAAEKARPPAWATWPRWTHTALGALAVFAVTLLVHGRTANFAFSHLDDDHLIVERWSSLRQWSYAAAAFHQPYFAISGPTEGYYRPLVTASFVMDAAGHPSPVGAPFHRTNVGLHAIAGVLLLLLLRQLGVGDALSLVLALAFAAHPALTMAVAWIPGRNDLLLAVFVLGAWLAYGRSDAPRPWGWFALHLALFAAAMFTKEAAIVLPVLLVAQRWLLEGRPPAARRDALQWAGWAGVVIVWWAMRSRVALGGDLIPLATRLAYVLDRLPGLVVHAGKLVLPFDLAPLADQRFSTLLWGWIALALLIAATVLARGQTRRLALLGWLVFLAFLLPTLAVSNTLLLENRLYLPAVGVALVVAAGVGTLPRTAVAVGGALVVTLLTIATFRYESTLRNPLAFADELMRTTPGVALAQTVAGDAWRENGDFARSEAAYRKSLELDPTQLWIHNNLGVFALRRGNLEQAEAEFRAELARNPSLDLAHDNLGVALWRMKRLDEAAAEWAVAVRLNPELREHLLTIYRLYVSKGLYSQAEEFRDTLAAHGIDASP